MCGCIFDNIYLISRNSIRYLLFIFSSLHEKISFIRAGTLFSILFQCLLQFLVHRKPSVNISYRCVLVCRSIHLYGLVCVLFPLFFAEWNNWYTLLFSLNDISFHRGHKELPHSCLSASDFIVREHHDLLS